VAAALGIGARQRPRSSPNSPRNSILKHGGEPGSVEFCHKTRARLRQLLPLPRPTGPSRCRAGRAEGEPAGRVRRGRSRRWTKRSDVVKRGSCESNSTGNPLPIKEVLDEVRGVCSSQDSSAPEMLGKDLGDRLRDDRAMCVRR